MCTSKAMATNDSPKALERLGQTPHHRVATEQLRLTVDSGAPSQMARSSTVHCQSELQGRVENRSSLAVGVAFDILWCCKVDNLQTSGYSLRGKYQ